MSAGGPDFFETALGRRFYDGDVPKLVKVLDRIATALEEHNKLIAAADAPKLEAVVEIPARPCPACGGHNGHKMKCPTRSKESR